MSMSPSESPYSRTMSKAHTNKSQFRFESCHVSAPRLVLIFTPLALTAFYPSRRPSRYLHGASRTAGFLPLPLFHPLPLFTPGQKGSIHQSWLGMVAAWVDEAFQTEIWAQAQTWREVGVNASRNLHGKGVKVSLGPAGPGRLLERLRQPQPPACPTPLGRQLRQ